MTRRRTREPSVCDMPGCAVRVTHGMMMCRQHWFATPRQLRLALLQALADRRPRLWTDLRRQARAWHAANPIPVPAARPARRPELTPLEQAIRSTLPETR